MLKLVRSRGVREDRTEHTKTFRRTLAGFGLTWCQKVNFSIFDGKLTFQCTRNCNQNHPFCPGSLQDTFIMYSLILHQRIFRKYFVPQKGLIIKKLETWKSKNPGSLTGAQLFPMIHHVCCCFFVFYFMNETIDLIMKFENLANLCQSGGYRAMLNRA